MSYADSEFECDDVVDFSRRKGFSTDRYRENILRKSATPELIEMLDEPAKKYLDLIKKDDSKGDVLLEELETSLSRCFDNDPNVIVSSITVLYGEYKYNYRSPETDFVFYIECSAKLDYFIEFSGSRNPEDQYGDHFESDEMDFIHVHDPFTKEEYDSVTVRDIYHWLYEDLGSSFEDASEDLSESAQSKYEEEY